MLCYLECYGLEYTLNVKCRTRNLSNFRRHRCSVCFLFIQNMGILLMLIDAQTELPRNSRKIKFSLQSNIEMAISWQTGHNTSKMLSLAHWPMALHMIIIIWEIPISTVFYQLIMMQLLS